AEERSRTRNASSTPESPRRRRRERKLRPALRLPRRHTGGGHGGSSELSTAACSHRWYGFQKAWPPLSTQLGKPRAASRRPFAHEPTPARCAPASSVSSFVRSGPRRST